ncbi:hypothetical protein SLA2020_514520 [Shorea laevis]
MTKPFLLSPFSILVISFLLLLNPAAARTEHDSTAGSLVKKSQRTTLVETEYGQVSEVNISAGKNGPYHLEFITLDPNSLFLPVLLHADMVFYVHTGSGTLSWADDNETKTVNLRRGDIYRLQPGSVFYVQGNVDPEREKLRIHALFSNADDASFEASIGAYSSIVDLVFGFHTKTLQSAFKVPEEVIEAMRNTTRPPVIVHLASKKRMTFRELEARFLKTILGRNGGDFFDFDNKKKKKKKTKVYNIFEAEPDFNNCYGWSATVDSQDLRFLKGSNVGVFMVNLTKGSMMGPHWNPSATEIAVVLQGQGMLRMVCSSRAKQSECKNVSFRVKEGDVFAVSRFHPMAQMSFNNDSLIFMGFSTTTKKNYPQFIAGKRSVLQVMDKRILALSFNVTNTTLDQIVSQQKDSLILDCTSCAEEEESIMEEEIRREKKEEEEKARKKEEEEARKREEEEEARKREEEEEEEASRQEEERRQREKEQEQKQEEEEARKREKEEEEARKREEEEARKREEEEEEEARRQEEERRQREKEQEQKREEEEYRKREEEEEAKKRGEEEQEEARQKEEEEEARRQQVEKQQERKREEEEREKNIGEEEGKELEEEEASKRAEKRRREEAKAREQEEARRQGKEGKRIGREEEEKAEWGEPETTLKGGAFWI